MYSERPLSELVSITKGKQHSLAGDRFGLHRYIQIDDLRNNDDVKYTNDTKGTFVKERDVVIAWDGANAGTIGYGLNGLIGSTLARLHIHAEGVLPEYLGRFLQSKVSEIRDNCTGATIPHVSKNHLESIPVPLPPLATQKHIARVLEQADQLRKQVQQMESELKQLAQSLFLEMFGDPVKNPKRWPIEVLGKHLEAIDSGWSPKCEERAAKVGEWGVLKLGAVTSCTYKDAENKKLPSDLSPRQKIEVRKGDLLFSRKNTYELVAATAYVRETQGRIMLSDLIFRLVPKTSLDAIYLWGLLSNPTFRAEVQLLAGGAAGSMPNISKTKLAEKQFPLPDLDSQLKYAEAMREFWKYSGVVNMKIRQLDDLFKTLMQRAFNGELTAPERKAA